MEDHVFHLNLFLHTASPATPNPKSNIELGSGMGEESIMENFTLSIKRPDQSTMPMCSKLRVPFVSAARQEASRIRIQFTVPRETVPRELELHNLIITEF